MHAPETVQEKALVRKVTWRIIPFVFLLYVISYLDRANIGYAALQMNADLAISSEVFGLVSGIFFIGYFLFEVPSNVMLNKFGARVWIARILVTWGLLAAGTAFVESANQLYVLRFLLGAAEAGFFPGIIVYLTQWFRRKELATTVALFTAAIPVSYVIGAPTSTWILDNVHWMGYAGWRWMLFLEGAPAVIFGVICYLRLADKPEDAKWLSNDEKAWLRAELDREQAEKAQQVQHLSVLGAMKNSKVLYLSFIYFVYQCGSLGVGYWMPQILKSLSKDSSHFEVGLYATLPYIVASIVMVLWSRRSDRLDERRVHSSLPLLLAAIAMFAAGQATSFAMALGAICLALSGLYAFKSPFWALPTLFLDRSTAAISIAVINSIGNLGGFVGPYLIGWIKGAKGGGLAALSVLSALLLLSFLMTHFIRLGRAGNDATNPATA